MWQCPNCGEEHEDRFETCWKCGTTSAGASDAEFRISQPAGEVDDDADSQGSEPALPSLQLPGFTYFGIPFFVAVYLVVMFFEYPRAASHAGLPDVSWLGIATMVLGAVFIGIPAFFTMARRLFFEVMRRHRSTGVASVFWFLTMFRLPRSIGQRHRWFVPVYYGSLVATVVGPLAIMGWHAWRGM